MTNYVDNYSLEKHIYNFIFPLQIWKIYNGWAVEVTGLHESNGYGSYTWHYYDRLPSTNKKNNVSV